jgi:peroxiredoxin Q/BCP
MSIRIGDRAPDLSLPGLAPGLGRATVKLSEWIGKRTVVLYFYPGDETPGCTREACSFRDAYEDFSAAGAEVIGVSEDDVASHESFAQHHRLPFVLASDLDGSARKAYGVKKTLGLIAGRVTFVIDREGVVRDVFDSQLRFHEHVRRALELVKRLEAK